VASGKVRREQADRELIFCLKEVTLAFTTPNEGRVLRGCRVVQGIIWRVVYRGAFSLTLWVGTCGIQDGTFLFGTPPAYLIEKKELINKIKI